VIVETGRVALIERHRGGLHYFTLPGGGVEAGETFEEAAVREAREELGVDVALGELMLELEYGGTQRFFSARRVGGTFGTGFVDEPKTRAPEKWGTYLAVWRPVDELPSLEVRPPEIVPLLLP
jgi:8-oxo-dGTP diphosphatase